MATTIDPRSTGAQPTTWLLVASFGGIVLGGVLRLIGAASAADDAWLAVTVLGLVPAVWWVVDAARHRRLGVDVIALAALVGTVAVQEHLAGAIVTVMLATGRTLESRASARARRDLRLLLERAPRTAHRYAGSELTSPPLEDVVAGDLLLVRPGEVVPVDGLVEGGIAVLDEAALTGEPLPVERQAGDPVRSGVVNVGGPFDLRARVGAAQSTYAGIVRLVEAAEVDTTPFVRLADRWAAAFLAVAAVAAGGAWALSGDAVRAVAVLVVATPCPLILAAPVAIVSGLSRAARRGVIIKGGAALERLGLAEVLLVDKTGTLTVGRPTLIDIVTAGGVPGEEVLRLAASLDQVSPHVLAAAVVRAARDRGLPLELPTDVREVGGSGVEGLVGGRRVAVGKSAWLGVLPNEPWARRVRRSTDLDGALSVFVAVDGMPAGALVLDDPIRTDAPRTIRRLRAAGIRRIVLLTGDRDDVARTVGAVLGVDDVLAERTPAEKLEAVRLERLSGPTMMVGDGINDAPALAAADVGVAVSVGGATASTEAADVVLTVDRLDRLGEAVVIAHRSSRLAAQSAGIGIGLSVLAMLAAGAGLLPPAWGALFQEGIDAAAIANALRAVTGGTATVRLDRRGTELTRRFRSDHLALRTVIERVRTVADALGVVPPPEALRLVVDLHSELLTEVAPHEAAEDAELYPVLAQALGGSDPMATMSRGHVEIAHLIRRLGRLLTYVDPEGPDDEDVVELRRLLYGLHAVLRLHMAQEEETYLWLGDDAPEPASG